MMASTAVVERIARHLFDLTPANTDRDEAMRFAMQEAITFTARFEARAFRELRRYSFVDLKSRAAGEREDEDNV